MKNKLKHDSLSKITIESQQNPANMCPNKLLSKLEVVDVEYASFNGKFYTGRVVVHIDLVSDIKGAFKLMLSDKFPIQSVIPISNDRYMWDDTLSTEANNTSAFNYRFVRNTHEMSNHSTGRAIDINPLINPYFTGNLVYPAHATYNPTLPGTIHSKSNIVKYFKSRGWQWGGDWADGPDYQHFEKLED